MRAVGLVLALWMLGGLSAQEQIDRTFLRRYNSGAAGGLGVDGTDDGGSLRQASTKAMAARES